MDPTAIMIPAAIPPGVLGTMLEPGALFVVWSAVVVIVLAGLTAVLGMHEPADTADETTSRGVRMHTRPIVASAPHRHAAAA